ncbi:MAG TPA: sigma-54 dependent transcriptional regulator [Polyangiaceae bacterium]|nr:sigma-54 dependent transcriptional regulator [Polyangiaceae bacterium]
MGTRADKPWVGLVPNAARGDTTELKTWNRLLLVDDDRELALRLGHSLGSLGWDVEVVHDGSDALRLLDARSYDAIVLDLEMAPTSGWQVLEHRSRLREPPPVVLVSGHLDVPSTVRALHLGVVDAYQKPVTSRELDDCLTRVISKRRGFERPLANPSGPDPESKILGESSAIQLLRAQIRQVARYRELPVLIVGETGAGKELVAREIHAVAPSGPFEAINCAAIPETLFESEVFGHEAGAFTDARDSKPGLLERARRGTVFFDEISETSEAIQARLLHVLETRSYRRVGGVSDLSVGARVVSATNRPPEDGAIGGIRADLYYRIAGITLVVPPLRDRQDDIPLLAEHFRKRMAAESSGVPRSLTPRALQALQVYEWPGNVRELKAVVEQAVILSDGDAVGAREVRIAITERSGHEPEVDQTAFLTVPGAERSGSLPTIERTLIAEAFHASQGNVSEAARQLGIPRSTLRDKLKRMGLVA